VTEAVAAHAALVSAWTQLFAGIEGARFERRSDLIVAVCPELPFPPCNGPWIEEDSPAAVEGLPGAIAEVDAAGAQACVHSRSGHERVQAAARGLGFVHLERLSGMVALPEELIDVVPAGEVAPITGGEVDATLDLLAVAFDEPRAFFARFYTAVQRVAGARWYVGRLDDTVVSTALGVTTDGATGIFNVATLPEHRRRGYGAALTARAARDGFAHGAGLAYLHASPLGSTVYGRLGFRHVEDYVVQARPGPG
jgi:ribosomal protein S18 acetylase RimI-like enzyme